MPLRHFILSISLFVVVSLQAQYFNVTALYDGPALSISNSATEVTYSNNSNFDLPFSIEMYGDSFDGIHWNNEGYLEFYNATYSSNNPFPVRLNVLNAYENYYEEVTLNDYGNFFHETTTNSDGSQTYKLFIDELGLTIRDENDVMVDEIYFDVQIDIHDNGDIEMYFSDVTYYDVENTIKPNFRIGLGQLINDGSIPLNSLPLSSGLYFEDAEYLYIGYRTNHNPINEWLYEGFYVSFSPNQNFYFSAYDERHNTFVRNNLKDGLSSISLTKWNRYGMNKYQDKGNLSKFVFDTPVEIKGVSTQNYGEYLENDDSLDFQIWTIGENGFPNTLIYSQKHSINCLALDGSLNDIILETPVTILDSCLMGFEYPEYSYSEDSPGIAFYYEDGTDEIDADPEISYVKMVDNKWYSVYIHATNSTRFERSGNWWEDISVLSFFPIVSNYDRGEDLLPNTACDPIGIGNGNNNELSIYPSVISNQSTFSIQDFETGAILDIFNGQGTLNTSIILKQGSAQVSTEALTVGMNFVRVTATSGKTYTAKVLKHE